MKEWIKRITIISFIVFCSCMAIFAILALSMKDKIRTIPSIVMFLFIISLGSTFIAIMVGCALSIIDDIKEGKKAQIIIYFIVMLICSIGYTLWKHHQDIKDFDGLFFFIKLVLIGCGSKGGVYMFQGKK